MLPYDKKKEKHGYVPEDFWVQMAKQQTQRNLRKLFGEEGYKEYRKKHCPWCLGEY